MSADTFPNDNPARTLQRKVLRVLAMAQILGAIGTGATMSLGAMLVVEVSGSAAWSGMAMTTGALGAARCWRYPLPAWLWPRAGGFR